MKAEVLVYQIEEYLNKNFLIEKRNKKKQSEKSLTTKDEKKRFR